MVVDLSNGTLGRGTDVGKDTASLGIGTDGTVVHVALGRLYGLVDGGSETFVGLAIFALASGTFLEVTVGRGVPGDTQTVGVEDAVAGIGFVFGGDLVGQVGDEARQVVVVDLVGERMLRGDKNIGQETGLGWRDVCEPAARGIGVCDHNCIVKYLPAHCGADR